MLNKDGGTVGGGGGGPLGSALYHVLKKGELKQNNIPCENHWAF